jgi:hypothetical protein
MLDIKVPHQDIRCVSIVGREFRDMRRSISRNDFTLAMIGKERDQDDDGNRNANKIEQN